MNPSTRKSSPFVAAIGSIGLVLLMPMMIGCTEESPTRSDPIISKGGFSAPTLLWDPASVPSVALDDVSVSKTIKVSDGTELTVGKVKVQIYERSLPRNMTVTVSLLDPERLQFRVEPAATTLRRAMKVTVTNLDQTDGGNVGSLSFFQRVGDQWLPIPTERSGSEVYGHASGFGDFAVGAPTAGGGSIQFVRWLDGPGYQTAWITALSGGTVLHDRYVVRIPPGALPYDAFVTVRDPAAGYIACDLEPHGIQFLIPVELEIDLSGTDYQPYTDWTIWWLDDANGNWVNEGGVFESGKVRTWIHHFSRRAAGRAGW